MLALARPSSKRESLDDITVEWVEGDLRDAPSIVRAAEGCLGIIHAAGHYPTSALRRRETMRRGVREIRNVLDAAAAANVRLVYVSSLSTIGLVHGRPANEHDGYVPGSVNDPYFEVKYAMEQEALSTAARGGNVVVVNPSVVLGPGDVKPTSGRLILGVARERLPLTIDGPVNIIDVRDMADAVVSAFERGRSGERYILGGENLMLRELFRRIAFDSGVREPTPVPHIVAKALSWSTELLALAGDLASRPLADRAPALAKRIRRPPLIPLEGISIIANGQPLDSTKARTELNLKNRPLETTLRDTIRWFRDKHYLL